MSRHEEKHGQLLALDPALLGVSLRIHRRLKGLTRIELAGRAKCSAVHIKKIEEGARTPSPELLQHLCKALGIEVRDVGKISAAPGRLRKRLRALLFEIDEVLEDMGESSLREALFGARGSLGHASDEETPRGGRAHAK